MAKTLRILKIILLLAWMIFLILCCHSCLMRINSGTDTPGGAAADSVSSQTAAASAAQTAAPAAPKADEVALSSGNYPVSTENLVAAVTPADLEVLDRFPALRSADFSGSTCYAEIINWAEQHPDVTVSYSVTLPDGQTLANTAESVTLQGIQSSDAGETARLLSFLPYVKSIDLGVAQEGSGLSSQDLAAFAAACPDAMLNYSLSFLGQEISLADQEVDFSSLTSAQVGDAASVLSAMNSVSLIYLGDESSGLSWDEVIRLHEAAPAAALDYGFTLWGITSNLAATDLSFSHIKMNDEGAAVRKLVPLMANLQTLDMDSCGVSNESMAVIRDENPSVNVIWRVNFAGYTARTDVERILASSTTKGGAVTDSAAQVLKYCTKVKYLDLGHNEVLTDISFTAYMPDLEVAIFAINNIEDISPLANCPKLEYLEINSTNVTDLTPLANSTALRHLNIGRTGQLINNTGGDLDRPRVTDISALFGLSDLERLFIGSLTAPGIPKEQIETMAQVMHTEKVDSEGNYCDGKVSPEGLPYNYVRLNIADIDPSQGTWRFAGYRPDWVWEQALTNGGVYNDPMNERYLLLREQFGYDNANQSYSLPANDPLY